MTNILEFSPRLNAKAPDPGTEASVKKTWDPIATVLRYGLALSEREPA